MQHDKFSEFTITRQLNGRDIEINITITVECDDIDPAGDFDFGNEKDNTEYLQRFHSGELFIGVIGVKATALGETGTDYLGGCHLHSNNYFDSKPFTSDVSSIVTEYNMVDNAIIELLQAIQNKSEMLTPFFITK